MYIFRCLHLLWFFPVSWIDSILIRKKPFEERYAHMARWGRRLMRLFKVRFDVTQEGVLPKDTPILFVSNHQSEFDMMMLVGGIDIPFSFISKMENKKLPYVGSWSKTLELIFFDREDTASAIHMLREAARRLKAHHNLLIFPEGTRTKDGDMLPLQAGSLQPAMMAKAYIVPVVIINSYDYINFMKHKGVAKMRILEPISFETYKPLKVDGLATVLQERMQNVLNEEKHK